MKTRSLKRQLIEQLLIPLFCLSLMGAGIAYWLAIAMSNEIYDELLLSASDSILARIEFENNKIVFDFPLSAYPVSAQAFFKHNDRDKFYYKICTPEGECLLGDKSIPMPLAKISERPMFFDGVINGAKVRIVSVDFISPRLPEHYLVVDVAETCNARNDMARKTLLTVILVEGALIVCGTGAILIGVRQGLSRLQQIQQALSTRSPWDLDPLVMTNVPEEVRPLVDAINTVLSQLRGHLDVQSNFLSNAAHQLRTPVAGLKTFIDLGAKVSDQEKSSAIFTQLKIGIGRLSHLIDQVLLLARVERGSVDPTRALVDLGELSAETISELISYCPSTKRQNIEFVKSGTPAMIYGDRASLRDLIENLVHNAISYTPDGGQITVSLFVSDGVELVVEDTGPGIPLLERERVFDRFYRLLGSEAEGSGLGLSIVKEIAEAHAGKISISDGKNGVGCRFSVSFAAAAGVPSEQSVANPPVHAA